MNEWLLAGWKVTQDDGLGDIFYFYPDGLFVQQGVRRREFVTIGRWSIEPNQRLLLSEAEPKNTSCSDEELAEFRNEKIYVDVAQESPEKMQWIFGGDSANPVHLWRMRDLPDRTEVMHWGLGTDESYDRGLRQQMR